jgi:hypothetical protein
LNVLKIVKGDLETDEKLIYAVKRVGNRADELFKTFYEVRTKRSFFNERYMI